MNVQVRTPRRSLDPTGEIKQLRLPPAERLDSLEGASIGFVDNGKPNTARFFRGVGDRLKRDWGLKDYLIVRKASMSLPATDLIMQRLRIHSRAIITGMGD